MLAWINLLQDDGWVNDVLVWIGIFDAPRNWLDGRASSVILGLVYGYVPFMILPLYAFLDRIDREPPRGRARSGREPLRGVPDGHASPIDAGDPGRNRDHRTADVR